MPIANRDPETAGTKKKTVKAAKSLQLLAVTMGFKTGRANAISPGNRRRPETGAEEHNPKLSEAKHSPCTPLFCSGLFAGGPRESVVRQHVISATTQLGRPDRSQTPPASDFIRVARSLPAATLTRSENSERRPHHRIPIYIAPRRAPQYFLSTPSRPLPIPSLPGVGCNHHHTAFTLLFHLFFASCLLPSSSIALFHSRTRITKTRAARRAHAGPSASIAERDDDRDDNDDDRGDDAWRPGGEGSRQRRR